MRTETERNPIVQDDVLPESERGNIVRTAVCQYAPILGDLPANVEKGTQAIQEAAEAGADLIVLPEMANSGYVVHSSAEARALAEYTDESPAVARWHQLAQEYDTYIVAGFGEKVSDTALYNSALVIGPTGILGTYRKTHLFFEEKLYYRPGDLGFPVFDLPFGRIGILICYDLRFPEASRILALKGADVICVPTNWVSMMTPDRIWDSQGYCQANYVALANAAMNQVYMACADRVGAERGIQFLGCSLIIDPAGTPLAGPASKDGEEVLVTEMNLSAARRAKNRNELNHTWLDRRTDLYSATLGYESGPPA
ncbi:MAG: nitrilase family protein [Chloroflexi bacterium]|nr:nitrilase family protein [Chloroflexota bacterium]